jgi:lysophospholipase L1-like esterase
LLAFARWRRFLVLGDSAAVSAGAATREYCGVSWTDRVAAALRAVQPGLAYLNLSRPELSASAVRAQQLAPAIEFRGDLAAVICGSDDTARASFDIDATQAELSRIITPLRDVGCDVLTVGWSDRPRDRRDRGSRGEMETYRARMRQLADRTRAVSLQHGGIFVDLTEHPALGTPGVYGADGRSLTGRGHAVVAAAVIRVLGGHLGMTDRPA